MFNVFEVLHFATAGLFAVLFSVFWCLTNMAQAKALRSCCVGHFAGSALVLWGVLDGTSSEHLTHRTRIHPPLFR